MMVLRANVGTIPGATAGTGTLTTTVNGPRTLEIDAPAGQHIVEASAGTSLLASAARRDAWFNSDNHDIDSVNNELTLTSGTFIPGTGLLETFQITTDNVQLDFASAADLDRFISVNGWTRPATTPLPGDNAIHITGASTPIVLTTGTTSRALGPNDAGNGTAARINNPTVLEPFLRSSRIITFRTSPTATTDVAHGFGTLTQREFTLTNSDIVTVTAFRQTATANVNETVPRIYPADRCTWLQTIGPNGRGYSISDARFYPGVTVGSSQFVDLDNASLGFIGKSGRFVEIAD